MKSGSKTRGRGQYERRSPLGRDEGVVRKPVIEADNHMLVPSRLSEQHPFVILYYPPLVSKSLVGQLQPYTNYGSDINCFYFCLIHLTRSLLLFVVYKIRNKKSPFRQLLQTMFKVCCWFDAYQNLCVFSIRVLVLSKGWDRQVWAGSNCYWCNLIRVYTVYHFIKMMDTSLHRKKQNKTNCSI